MAYVDLNLHGGGANSMFGLSSNNGLIELLNMGQRPDDALFERMFVTKGDRLHVLSAELAYGADVTLGDQAVARLVDMLKDRFHYVLFDVGSGAGKLLEDALVASDLVHVVVDRSVHAAYEAARLVRFVRELPGERLLSMVLNNPLAPVAGRVEPVDFEAAFGGATLHELPHEPQTLAVAENLGEPIEGAKRNGFLDQIRQLANGITGEPMAVAEPWYARLVKWRKERDVRHPQPAAGGSRAGRATGRDARRGARGRSIGPGSDRGGHACTDTGPRTCGGRHPRGADPVEQVRRDPQRGVRVDEHVGGADEDARRSARGHRAGGRAHGRARAAEDHGRRAGADRRRDPERHVRRRADRAAARRRFGHRHPRQRDRVYVERAGRLGSRR